MYCKKPGHREIRKPKKQPQEMVVAPRPAVQSFIIQKVQRVPDGWYSYFESEFILTVDTILYTAVAVEIYMLSHDNRALFVKLADGTIVDLITPFNEYYELSKTCRGKHRQEFLDLLKEWK